ncbi:uncharacterized protein LOC126698212 [Quercus robur]|uniref:uncharacterized protein LOC126698212 n=1 Tax=Quercus robur TaxID=38942 RepID=UPI002162E6FE|nr:uncharacterized protein LOC126698212 [Quercus robur]
MSVARISTEDNDREPKKAKKGASPMLGFSDEYKIGTIQPHNDALIVTLRIGGYDVKRVLVDQGNVMEVMYPDLYRGLNLKPEGNTVTPKGQIRLPIQTGSDVVEVDFIVVDTCSPYMAIVARPWLHALGQLAIPALPGNESTEEAKCEDLEKVAVGVDSEKFFQVGSELPPQEKEELIGFLRGNVDVFAWDTYEAPGVDSSFICHHLNVNPSATPKKQPPWRPSKEHANAVRDKVMKLKKAEAIKEVFIPSGWPILLW